MTILQAQMTTAGIAACFAADGLGLSAAIAEIALGDVGWSPTAAATALDSERVRVGISGGELLAGTLQLHLTAFVPAGTPEFWVRELGLFLDDGTMLAVWSDPADALVYRSELADTLLTFDLVLSGIPAGSISITESGDLYIAQGTTSRIGALRLATDAEVQAGAPNTPAVEPSGLHALLGNLPFFPEIETANHRLAITAGSGSIVLNAGQTWLWRGFRRYSTDDYALVNRTFAHVANKTYHLRWRRSTGVISLVDVSNAGYNPSALAETAAAFDSTYDDMLIARVVTSAGNVATVTALANAIAMRVQQRYPNFQMLGSNAPPTLALAWARSPETSVAMEGYSNVGMNGDNWDSQAVSESASIKFIRVRVATATRYAVEFASLYADVSSTGGTMAYSVIAAA